MNEKPNKPDDFSIISLGIPKKVHGGAHQDDSAFARFVEAWNKLAESYYRYYMTRNNLPSLDNMDEPKNYNCQYVPPGGRSSRGGTLLIIDEREPELQADEPIIVEPKG